jgi:hypothetical protein
MLYAVPPDAFSPVKVLWSGDRDFHRAARSRFSSSPRYLHELLNESGSRRLAARRLAVAVQEWLERPI